MTQGSHRTRRRRWVRRLLRAACVLFIAANALAFMHAYSMTHFGTAGPKPLRPNEMSLGQKLRAVTLAAKIPRPTNAFTPMKYDLSFETHHFTSSDGINIEA